MADEQIDRDTDTVGVRRPLWQSILKWIALTLLGIVVLLGMILVGINTDPGRRFVADQLGGYTTASGLNIKVGRIDGSLYGHMILSDLRVSDPKGVFVTSPRLDVDWRPFDYLHHDIDVRSLDAALITLARQPALKATPSDPNAPLLPDLDIDIAHLRIDRFLIAKPLTGQVHVLSLGGTVHIANRRAQLSADAVALRAPGVAGGDRLKLTLDAVPDANKLNVDIRLDAPTGGVVATIAGLKAPLTVRVGGKGSWASWQGHALATLGAGQLADLGVTERSGHIGIRGVTRPGLYLPGGAVDHLTAPALQVAIDTTLDQRKADTRIKLASSALAVDAGGLIDLASSRFSNFAVDAQLLTPGAIAPQLTGRDVAARVVLDGAFATPTVDYKLRAGAIGFCRHDGRGCVCRGARPRRREAYPGADQGEGAAGHGPQRRGGRIAEQRRDRGRLRDPGRHHPDRQSARAIGQDRRDRHRRREPVHRALHWRAEGAGQRLHRRRDRHRQSRHRCEAGHCARWRVRHQGPCRREDREDLQRGRGELPRRQCGRGGGCRLCAERRHQLCQRPAERAAIPCDERQRAL